MILIRGLILVLASQLFFNKEHAVIVQASDIRGNWSTTDNEAIVEVYERNNQYFGRIISLSKPLDKKGNPKKDHRNKDPYLRSRPLIGLHTLYNLTFSAGEQKWHGKVYIPLTGMEVDAVITLKDHNSMNIRGSFGNLRKTQVWVRANK